MMRAIDISTTALVAQRQRLNTIASNIANVHTTRDEQGNASPFHRRFVTFSSMRGEPGEDHGGQGVEFNVQVDTDTPARQLFQPGHPDADENGYVSFPAINLVTEFVNAMEASRAYEANVGAIDTTKKMGDVTSRILA